MYLSTSGRKLRGAFIAAAPPVFLVYKVLGGRELERAASPGTRCSSPLPEVRADRVDACQMSGCTI